MRLSIQRLRWVLLAGAVLLLAVLAAYIGYGHYRMIGAYRRILARSGVSISRDSSGITYSQSVGGKKIFTLRAVKETSLGNGRWALHDADLLLYTRNAEHPDHIYGKEFEYDQKTGVASALGDVYMDLEAPKTLAGKHKVAPQHPQYSAGLGGGEPATAVSRQGPIIHVRTSGLVYQRGLGLVSTSQKVEFAYAGVQCTAVGATFDTKQNVLHLLAHVTMDGAARGRPLHITASHADLDRADNVATLTQPVAISGDRRATADQAVVDLRQDGSIEQARGLGDVVLAAGTRQIAAQRLDAALSPQSALETAQLSGGVRLTDSSALRPMRGAAQQVNVVFDAQGAPQRVIAAGGAQISMVDHTNPAAGARGLEREAKGDTIVALFVRGTRRGPAQLSEVQLTGAARMQAETLAAKSSPGRAVAAPAGFPPTDTVQVAADDLRVLFGLADGGGTAGARGVVSGPGRAARSTEPRTLYGTGNTLLKQATPRGGLEISRGDTLVARFAPAQAAPPQKNAHSQGTTLVSAVQTGHVTVYDRAAAPEQTAAAGRRGGEPAATADGGEVSTGSAQRAVYDAAAGTVTLSGAARMETGDVALIAPTVILDRETGGAEAVGGVQTTMLNAAARGSATPGAASTAPGRAPAAPESVTHVVSATATFRPAAKLAKFLGGDRDPARLWQGASQVQAAVLVLDGARHSFIARPAAAGGLVHAVFASASGRTGTSSEARPKPSAGPGFGGRGAAAQVVRVASPRMNYDDLRRAATFSGGVRIEGSMGEVRGQSAVVFLAPATKPAAGGQANAGGQPLRQPSLAQSGPLGGPLASPLGGSLERVVVSGDVRIEQAGRDGTAEQLLYTAATGSYVLTGSPGHPPRIVDAQQGSITGATLLFRDGGSTIVVAGEPGAKPGRRRVRTETEVRQ